MLLLIANVLLLVVNGNGQALEEYRHLWVASVDNIDWPSAPGLSTADQIAELDTYLNIVQNTNFNSVILQIRPVGDALYNSTLEPWSKYLSGSQGTAPEPYWDPLEYATTEAHSRGLELHAWVNPYRANYAPDWEGLDPSHMALRWSQYAYPYSDYLWMDPGAEVIADHFIDVVSDILSRYDVDGIHFDDYFYPYPVTGVPFPDNATYEAYLNAGGSLSLADWRRDNINRMVERVYQTTQSYGRKLSISPFALYRPGNPEGMPPPLTGFDPYEEQYADSKLWLQQGWMDMFLPQIYWEIEPPEQSYPEVLDWWLAQNSQNVQIQAGLAGHKLDPARGDWPVSEILNEIEISRLPDNRERMSLGNSFFGAKYLRDDLKGIVGALQSGPYDETAAIPQA